MSAFPSEVILLGTTFRVELCDLAEDAGQSNQCERIIRINSSLPFDVQVESFYHELVHMMMGHLGLDYMLTPPIEETFSQALGVALVHVLSANPLLPRLEYE